MIFDILTLFPTMLEGAVAGSLLGKAQESGRLTVRFWDIREHAAGKHRVCDDTPYGGGAGMVMKVEPVVAAIEARRQGASPHVILLGPGGAPFDQAAARRLASHEHLVLVCGRYEGIDHRVGEFVDEELSLGDFVLSGGEPAAFAILDAVARLVPGVLGNCESLRTESFEDGLLEYPQYTRPPAFRGHEVPEVLLGGDHARILAWRREQSLLRTSARRPDLLEQAELSDRDRAVLAGTDK